MRVIPSRSLPVEILRLFMPDGFDEIGYRCKSCVAIPAHPAVMTFEIGAELSVRAEAGDHVAVVEVMRAEVFHHAIPFKNRAAEIPR
jgi:hypothetical protein